MLKAGRLALEAKSVWPLRRLHYAQRATAPYPLSRRPPSLRSAGAEARTARPRAPYEPRPRQLRCASFGVCHEGCFRLQPQELLSVVPPRCRIPLTREPLGKRVPAASSQVPCRGRHTGDLRRPGALKITASCGRKPVRACHAHCFHRPFPPRPVAVRAPVAPASFTPHPSLRWRSQSRGVAAHPPPGERWPPPSQGAALRARAASAVPLFATSSRPGSGVHRPHRRRRPHPRRHPLSAHLRADSGHAASPARSQPVARIAGG